jgi:PAS domain S-box-containing protein
LRNDAGAVVGCIGFAQDVTEQKRAELDLEKARDELERRVEERTAALQEANEQLKRQVTERRQAEEQLHIFKTFADAAGQGFGMADMDGNITYTNPALAALMGEASPEQAIGKHVSAYYPSDYLNQRETEIFPVVSREGYWQGELTLISLAGEQIPTIQTSFTLPDESGKPMGRGVVVTDLRQIKQAEKSLREKLNELQVIYDGMVDGLLIADVETKAFAKSNRAMSQMVGYTPQELDSMCVADMHREEDLPTVLEAFRSLAQERLDRAESVPLLRKDGSVFYADITASPIVYNGRPCLIGFFRDVTERRRTEEALHRMLQASDRDRELITYEIHDGVAQRLAAALMQLDAYQHVTRMESPAVKAAFDAGMRAVREASSEARSLMNRTNTPVLRKFGVAAAIADFIDQFSEKPDSPEITYSCEGRPKRLEPVLENTVFRVAQEAITNACLHSKAAMVRVGLIQNGGDVTIEVKDDGVGFDTSKVKENRFGLHSIRERTRLLGKSLHIESSSGKGTQVRATFPLICRDE